MKHFLIICLFCINYQLSAQELFIQNEPATTIPKKALAVRVIGQSFQEADFYKNWMAAKFMYGVTSKLTATVMPSISNHHGKKLNEGFLSHYHVGNETVYYSTGLIYSTENDYQFEGVNLNLRYRIYANDKPHEHFRVALNIDGSTSNQAHDEAEPNLHGDNAGFGAGIISTYLKNKFAASFNGQVIFPKPYSETTTKNDRNRIEYGTSYIYNLSFGYLLFPRKLNKYSQFTVNVYAEFLGKTYPSAKVFLNGDQAEVSSNTLTGNSFIEVYPGLQFLINSNTRIDLSAGFNLYKKSYVHFYPMFTIGIQRYFYL